MRVCSGVASNHILHVSPPLILKPPPPFYTQSAAQNTLKTRHCVIQDCFAVSWPPNTLASASSLQRRRDSSAPGGHGSLTNRSVFVLLLRKPEFSAGRSGSQMKPERSLTPVCSVFFIVSLRSPPTSGTGEDATKPYKHP